MNNDSIEEIVLVMKSGLRCSLKPGKTTKLSLTSSLLDFPSPDPVEPMSLADIANLLDVPPVNVIIEFSLSEINIDTRGAA